jgi:hypothetical protein
VVFTSIHDGSAGGVTDTSSEPQAGDWVGVTVSEGGTAVGSFLTVRYASTGLTFTEGDGTLTDVALENLGFALSVMKGHVRVRGRFVDVGFGISACSWGSASVVPDCFVNASESDWGNPGGPFPPTGELVCGTVYVWPWINAAPNAVPHLFQGDCGSGQTPAPDQVAAISAADFDATIDQLCNGSLPDACQYWQDAHACVFEASSELIRSQIPFAFEGEDIKREAATTFIQQLLDAANTWAISDPLALSDGLVALRTFAAKFVGVSGTLLALAKAHGDCQPHLTQ